MLAQLGLLLLHEDVELDDLFEHIWMCLNQLMELRLSECSEYLEESLDTLSTKWRYVSYPLTVENV